MAAPRSVLLNALYLAPGESGGTETYLRGLAPALAAELPDLRITIVTTRSGARALREDGWDTWAEIRALPCEDGQRVRRLRAEQLSLARLIRRERPDIVHSLANVAPLYPGAPSVLTLHDLTFITTRTLGRVSAWSIGFLAKSAARRADGLITVTAAAREEICAVLGMAPERLAVIHHGLESPRARVATPERAVRERYELQGSRVLLCVAAKRPHKNQELLIRAVRYLQDDVQVVLAGYAEPYELELRALVEELGVKERVRFIGYAPDADLKGLWAIADCAAFPTLAEGFGIPIIEALAHGVPVAASDIPVLHEIGAELPHYFNPHDPIDAARAIEQALADGDTRAQGPIHAARFTWSAAARATHEVYERVLSRGVLDGEAGVPFVG